MTSIRQIKQHAAQLAESTTIPAFWVTDWLLYVINKPALFLMTDDDYVLSGDEVTQFNAGVTQMQKGMPLAYLTGTQAFWSLDFAVNEHTLIPRPDTEVLVEQTLSWIKGNNAVCQNKRLLDLGTGSGCIAISLAHELAQNDQNDKGGWQVVAVDLSSEALSVAKQNAINNDVNNIEFIQSSWYDKLSYNATFDVIVSNPPYIDEADAHLTKLTAEPISALSAPNQGLADIEYIVSHAPNYLNTGGLLVIEHGFDQGMHVRQLFVDNGFDAVQTVQDYGGNERITLGIVGNK